MGLSVNRLIRVSYGPFHLSDLAEGAVQELKGRMLRDQLGERLIMQANADFDAPILKPFSNSAVVAEKQSQKDLSVTNDGWVFSSERTIRRRSRDGSVEHDRTRLRAKSHENVNKGKSEQGKAERFLPRSRRANVWMAPGARPQSARKKSSYSEEKSHDHKGDFPDKKSFHRGKEKRKDNYFQKEKGHLQKESWGSFIQKRSKTSYDEVRTFGKQDRFLKDKKKMIKGGRDERSFEKKNKVKSFSGAMKKSKSYGDSAKTSKRFGGPRADHRR